MAETATAPPDTEASEEKLTEEERIAAAKAAAEERTVAIRESEEKGILAPARMGWDPAQVEAIRRTVAKECDPSEFVMFLELCARYELDPFAKQIYAAKMRGQVVIIVSRDGLLAHAHRQTDFAGMVGDVVHKDDTFKVSYDSEGNRQIVHEYSGWEDRGEIVGAWTMVKRKGFDPTYFFAPFTEYSGENVWKKNPSAMILKVAETYALRKAYSISGVVGEEEIERDRRNLTAVPEEPDWGTDEVLADRLQELVERANEVKPGSYRPKKVKTLLDGATQEQRTALADELERFIEDNAPAEAEGAEEVKDAEVVPEGDEAKGDK